MLCHRLCQAIHITHCLKLLNNSEALSVLPQSVAIIKEKKKSKSPDVER